jgi:hypothetical protein
VENNAVEPVVLTTTLYSLRKHHACESRYDHLASALGPDYGDKTINLLAILEHNGVDDCLWALCATDQNCDKVARLMAADFAEAVLPLYEGQYPGNTRPRAAIQAARDYAHGRIGDATRDAASAAARAAAARAAARAAATWDAARDAARAAATWDAARDAARAAARAAATWDAARDAAWAAARAAATWDAARDAAWAAARAAQADIIRKYLKVSE